MNSVFGVEMRKIVFYKTRKARFGLLQRRWMLRSSANKMVWIGGDIVHLNLSSPDYLKEIFVFGGTSSPLNSSL